MRKPATEAERYERLADKRNKRAEAQNPLFAAAGILHEVVHVWTPEDVRQEHEEHQAKLAEGERRMLERAQRMRKDFAALVSPEQLAEADRQWAESQMPKVGAYECEYWRKMLEQLELRSKPSQHADYGYIDQMGRTLVVTDLYSDGREWATGYIDQRTGLMVRHMLTISLPIRATQAEARADLDKYAEWCELERTEVQCNGREDHGQSRCAMEDPKVF